jgi:hypothetical protein
LQEILRVEGYIGNNTKQNKNTINDDTIQGYEILHEVKYKDDNIHESSGVQGSRYQLHSTWL